MFTFHHMYALARPDITAGSRRNYVDGACFARNDTAAVPRDTTSFGAVHSGVIDEEARRSSDPGGLLCKHDIYT